MKGKGKDKTLIILIICLVILLGIIIFNIVRRVKTDSEINDLSNDVQIINKIKENAIQTMGNGIENSTNVENTAANGGSTESSTETTQLPPQESETSSSDSGEKALEIIKKIYEGQDGITIEIAQKNSDTEVIIKVIDNATSRNTLYTVNPQNGYFSSNN